MALNIDDGRTDLLIKLDNIIDKKLPAPEAKLIKAFAAEYYLGVSPYDLREKSILDLYGALLSEWHFIYKRKPNELKIKVYNPQLEQNGWQSVHTVIEIVYDNKPFILDSIRLALNRMDLNIHLIIHAEGIRFYRDKEGKIKEILPVRHKTEVKNSGETYVSEVPIFIEIDKQSDKKTLDKIAQTLCNTLEDVDLMVKDWQAMTDRMVQTIATLEEYSKGTSEEVINFLRWIADEHFTFIGYAEYTFDDDSKPTSLDYCKGSGLGVLTDARKQKLSRSLADMYPDAREVILGKEVLLLGKTDTLSTVHRPVYTDFIAVKIFDEDGKLIKMKRFIGLYTAAVYNEPAVEIPYIRTKIDRIFEMAGFQRDNHYGRSLLHIIENLPRDELFQARDKELFVISVGILHLQERQRIRMFMRRDIYGRYFSVLVFVPRELFNSQLRSKMQGILLEILSGESVSFDTKFSESILARIHFIIRMDPRKQIEYEPHTIEDLLVEAARSWKDDLYDALSEHLGEEKSNELFRNYENGFPISYRELFTARAAVLDIEHIEKLKQHDKNYLEMSLYRPIEDPEDSFRFKLFRNKHTIPLSDIVPILERMGLRIISERPHEITLANNGVVWINDYRMVHPRGEPLSPEIVKDVFQEAFNAIWHEKAENDGFNKLVLSAQLGWRDISVLRMYYRYLWQTGIVFSQNSVEDALYNNCDLAKKLIEYFYTKFNTSYPEDKRNSQLTDLKALIDTSLEKVSSLNEDRIVRYILGAIVATVRTNYFQKNKTGHTKDYISIKLESRKVLDLPLPKPLYEIFVYSPAVEGIHLRGDKVARGGLRWSDRQEDFRTEVLGLMKAQHVKNAVIVPFGAKGGFVVKKELADTADRDQRMKVGIDCYKTLIRGLLDITDNRNGDEIIKPKDVICWDEDDPYLVVAADKGTATFSDIANAISAEYNFWLGDAFASGGSAGYDHKKMGITARGSWESVKMHFKLLGIDVQNDPITVVGIGDMAGDVFGNAMLLSDKLKLIAAFNHMHIFFDPNPEPETSFEERKRLFEMPGSMWSDYNPEVISKGGGVFSRSAKQITLTPQMKKILDCKKDHLMPNELIRAILMLKVDLYYNGGIGTYVKATGERNLEVGDRVNDLLRINGDQLNARVVCEGGNLGLTQLGRIEYAKNGGIINTDAIDNSAGVNCSDNEVNIKILLNEVLAAEEMTEKQRDQLLASMTDQVAGLVLENNIRQNEAITLTSYKSAADLQMHNRLLKVLEKTAGLNPDVEFMPDAEEILDRSKLGLGFTRPEIAILLAYTKIFLKKEIMASKLPDDPHILQDLMYYFPKELRQKKFKPFVEQHRLRRAIISTQISNYIVDEMGITFIQRLQEESGATSSEVATSYIIAREVFDVFKIRGLVRKLGVEVDAQVKIGIQQDLNRLVRRGTRWYLRNRHSHTTIDEMITKYKPLIDQVQDKIDFFLQGAWLARMVNERVRLTEAGVPDDLAKRVSTFGAMFTALDIVTASLEYTYPIEEVAKVYFSIGARLKLGWFGELIKDQPVDSYWDAMARASFRDDVDKQQRDLTISILQSASESGANADERVEQWLEKHTHLLDRWNFFVNELKATTTPDFTMFAVALRELFDLAQAINCSTED